jgi:hypothetical protein
MLMPVIDVRHLLSLRSLLPAIVTPPPALVATVQTGG